MVAHYTLRGGEPVNLTVWMLSDYGPDGSRWIRRLDLNQEEVFRLLNSYRQPTDIPKVTYFASEHDARAALSRLEVVQ